MNAWALAIEPGHIDPGSFLTEDGGVTWRNNRMCYLNAVNGEYLVRVRLAEGEDPAPPPMVFNDPDHPRLAALREILPAAARAETLPARERIEQTARGLGRVARVHLGGGGDCGVLVRRWEQDRTGPPWRLGGLAEVFTKGSPQRLWGRDPRIGWGGKGGCRE